MAASAIKMDELLVMWLSSDAVYENVLEWIENYRAVTEQQQHQHHQHQHQHPVTANRQGGGGVLKTGEDDNDKIITAGKSNHATKTNNSPITSNDNDCASTSSSLSLSSYDTDHTGASWQRQQRQPNLISARKADEGSGGLAVGAPPQPPPAPVPPPIQSIVIPPFYFPPPTPTTTTMTRKSSMVSGTDDALTSSIHDDDEDNLSLASSRGSGRRRRTPLTAQDTWDPLTTTGHQLIANVDPTTSQQPPTPKPAPSLDDENHASSSSVGPANTMAGGSTRSTVGDATLANTHFGDNSNHLHHLHPHDETEEGTARSDNGGISGGACVRDLARAIFLDLGQDPPLTSPLSIGSNQSADPLLDQHYGQQHHANNPFRHHHQQIENNHRGGEGATAEEVILYRKYLTPASFVRVTKEICRFPSFFNIPLYHRILDVYHRYAVATVVAERRRNRLLYTGGGGEDDDEDEDVDDDDDDDEDDESIAPMEVVTYSMLEWYWKQEMEPFDAQERFFRLVKQPDQDAITRDDFLPFIKALLTDHPGLEFLSSHAEFQEKYAVTVITRVFYAVNQCHSGRMTSRQVRRSDLLSAFVQVDEEEDINKVTRYFSYEHFYVLYCRFWELDHDRDYRITREDLLKYGDHSLSHMIVDRIFDAAPRPFNSQQQQLDPQLQQQQRSNHRDYLSYEDFIYFMLSEEDKSNEVSVRYWFSCIDVDGDSKLNNMEMRSFYAVQLHRMQCMGHEIVPFEDMLCQMMDMIKPANPNFFVVEDFLKPECCQVAGALFDALFNLNKYLMFEQRDPFVERQKREDEFECDWDRFACIDYNRLAMEEEAREEEAMEIDWVTVDDDDDDMAMEQQQHQQQQQQQYQQQLQQQQQQQHLDPAGGGGGAGAVAGQSVYGGGQHHHHGGNGSVGSAGASEAPF